MTAAGPAHAEADVEDRQGQQERQRRLNDVARKLFRAQRPKPQINRANISEMAMLCA